MDDSQYIRCFGYMILCYLHHHPGKCLINKDTVRAQILPHAASESGAGSSLGSVPKEPTLLGTTPHHLFKF